MSICAISRWVLLIIIFSPSLVNAATIAEGERIFNDGMLPSGVYVEAAIQGDIPVKGAQLACVSCHRKSRLGSSESVVQVPPLDYDSLFSGVSLSVNEQRGVSQQGATQKRIYTDESLARVIRDGIKPDGQSLNEVMPRYQLNDVEMQGLLAYIKSFKLNPDPGVNETELHIATAFSDENPAEAAIMLDVLQQFFADKNANIRHETRRAQHTPWTREWWYKSYRKLILHQWHLTGSPETWAQQLELYYKEQPVFAMVSGLGTKWQIVDEFCESHQTPCLLPNIIQPPATEGYYTRYFSPGVVMEAAVLAQYHLVDPKETTVIQLVDQNLLSQLAASSYQKDLGKAKQVVTVSTDKLRQNNILNEMPASIRTVIYWGSSDHLSDQLISKLTAIEVERLCVSSTLMPDVNSIKQKWPGEFCVVSPYRFKNRQFDDARTMVWLRRKGLGDGVAMRLKFNTYYAAKLVSDAIIAIRGNFSRDFFIEKIEHMVDKSLIKPDYAHMSSGPGQRYMSRGAYVLVSSVNKEPLSIGYDWTIPD